MIDQDVVNKTIFDLMAANEHKGEEAVIAGFSTVQALENVVRSLVKTPSVCNVM